MFMALSPYVITPSCKNCFGKAINCYTDNVFEPENILNESSKTTRLAYPAGGVKPRLIIDLGEASPGGYPVFRVSAKKGTPVLRIAYADWYDYIVDDIYGEQGDFTRGSCKYLGVELPVLPANPNRYELYTICRTGIFSYPLVQGQQRFVMITLDTQDTEVELEYFYIYYTSDLSETAGLFESTDERLNRLWYASTYTVQIASINNSHSWEAIDGRLALRALTKGNEVGIYKKGLEWTDYTFEFSGEIACNPDCASGIGWMIRAVNPDNGYLFRLNTDGSLQTFIRKNGINYEQTPRVTLHIPIFCNMIYRIKTTVEQSNITVYINDTPVLSFADSKYQKGTIGFCQTVEKWAFAHSVKVYHNTEIYLEDCFKGDLEDYEFTRSKPFLADGAKRDRLPWSGDLDWAGRNAYYAFQDQTYMKETLFMLARHQLPNGYIWAVCYPEDTCPPADEDYGYYESDIFSAWFVPSLADYLLFTNDCDTADKLWNTAAKSLDYLWQYIENDGLFFQRYQTSKGIWDHCLNDIGKFSYTNIIVYHAFADGAFIANTLGYKEEASRYQTIAEQLKNGILSHLWNKDNYLQKSIKDSSFCFMSNAMALSVGLLPNELANKAVSACLTHLEDEFIYGKTLASFIRGCFQYQHAEIAYSILTGSTGSIDFLGNCSVDWISAVLDSKGPATTTECMAYGKQRTSNGLAWSDSSHPDTAVAYLLTGYLLGIQPISPGYQTFSFAPYPVGIPHIKGIIPTPFGDIIAEINIQDDKIKADLSYPKGTCPIVQLEKRYQEHAVIHFSEYE